MYSDVPLKVIGAIKNHSMNFLFTHLITMIFSFPSVAIKWNFFATQA